MNPDQHDGPTHEGPSPYHGGLTTPRGRREDCTGPDCGPVEPEQCTTLADILRGAADRIDAEDVPQTAEDVADFVDGARWATAQLRRIAGEADAEPAGDATPDWLVDLVRRYAPVTRTAVLREGENALREKAGQVSELAEETMRRDLEETAQIWHEAASALAQLASEEPQS